MFLKEIRQDGTPDLDDLAKTSLNRRMKYRQRLQKKLRVRFRSEYLGQLERRDKSKRNHAVIKKGDLVLIARDNQKRLNWPLGRVLQVIAGNDGIPHIAKVKTADGELVRPLQTFLLLEGAPDDEKREHNAIVDDTTLGKNLYPCENVIEERETPVLYPYENLNEELETPVLAPCENVVKPSEILQNARTRSGRMSKPPKRLNI